MSQTVEIRLACNVEDSFKNFPGPDLDAEWLPKCNQFCLLVQIYISGKIFMTIQSVIIFNMKLLTDRQADKCRIKHNLLRDGKKKKKEQHAHLY